MSDHSHDSHDHGHDSHNAHDAHGQGDHGGHGDSHGEHWGDYNAQPLPPSNLPPVSGGLLVAFGVALVFLLSMIVGASFMLTNARPPHTHAAEKE